MTPTTSTLTAPVQLVWYKRDLRISDHAPLGTAAAAGPVLPLYIHEPTLVHAADCSAQHSRFLAECLACLRGRLQALGADLLELTGEAVVVLEHVWQATRFAVLWSHQETTGALAFARDRAVADWCRQRGVVLREMAQNGVLRGAAYRDPPPNWNQHFRERLFAPPLPVPVAIRFSGLPALFDASPAPSGRGSDKPARLAGGRAPAEFLLGCFFSERLLHYRGAISSPLTAPEGCSRLSPYLALGVVSMREVAAALTVQHARAREGGDAAQQAEVEDALQFYVERLYWRSAYLQLFEADPSLEMVSQHPGTRGLRETEFNEKWFLRWQAAETGYPFIDAGLRMLAETGWVNMRLRGTLISFAVNELWLHWREPALFLAREFLDYEPGIHYSQMQIHSGTALSTHPLMYNPVKQAQDHDPRGEFVRKWLPQLAKVPTEFIFEPWKMPRAVQAGCGVHIGQQYPAPLVPYEAAGHAARTLVMAARDHRPPPALAYTRQRLADLRTQRQGDLFG
jgi:deoxyribodipyrimidine photo-lyase